MFLGIYHHESPADLAPYITSTQVSDTFTHEAEAFVSAYVAKSLLFLRKIP